MSKFNVPTVEDVRSYAVNPEILRYLQAYRQRHGLQEHEVRTLDWGCGRGEVVARLLADGFDAMGADIDDQPLELGTAYFHRIDDPQAAHRLHKIDARSRLQTAEAASFDYIFSQTVLEHVAHLDDVAVELYRLLKPGGESFHAFPAHRHVVEDHMGMPFVHWLPKNRTREWLIRFWMSQGREPRWVDEDHEARVRRYYKYINQHTYYRSPRQIRRVFESVGFEVEFVSGRHPKVQQHPVLGRMLRVPGLRPVVDGLVTTFTVAELWLRKPL